MDNILRRTFAVSVIFFLVYFLFYQIKSYKKYIKIYNTKIDNSEGIYRRPSSILLELNELMRDSENFTGRIFIYPEDFDPETRSLDMLIQYNLIRFNYTIVKSKSIDESMKKNTNSYLIFHKLKKIPNDFKYLLLRETENYKLVEIIP